ncbi:hypothetical protein AAHA92_02777 [Salvia divinorum]|uniref:Uncharacterized protein n=1 Tax=Salvia divinorum TaxID=28513 RepID=A0ABD1IHK3_SALDI
MTPHTTPHTKPVVSFIPLSPNSHLSHSIQFGQATVHISPRLDRTAAAAVRPPSHLQPPSPVVAPASGRRRVCRCESFVIASGVGQRQQHFEQCRVRVSGCS